jgi:hypothetical protein
LSDLWDNHRMAGRAAPTPHLEYLKKQLASHGTSIAVRISAHADTQITPGKPPRYFYAVDFQHPERGWLALTEARSEFKVRTWWSLDGCVAALRDAGVRETRLHLLWRQGDLPVLRWPPQPTRSRHRKAAIAV